MREKNKDYSVLMSVYVKERPAFLRESIQSVYDQTVKTNDFVLVCDGELNGELEMVIDEMRAKFGKRMTILRLAQNCGLGVALRYGVRKCKNELVMRMDSDDVAKKDRAEKQLAAFNSMDVDVVGSNVIEYDIKMEIVMDKKVVPEKHNDIVEMLRFRNPFNHMSVMFRKNKVLAAGNYVEMPFFEDYYLWARMAKGGCKFFNLQECLVKVRGGIEMTSRRGGVKYLMHNVRFQRALRENGTIDITTMVTNVVKRSVVALMPNALRARVYSRFLRNSDPEEVKLEEENES